MGRTFSQLLYAEDSPKQESKFLEGFSHDNTVFCDTIENLYALCGFEFSDVVLDLRPDVSIDFDQEKTRCEQEILDWPFFRRSYIDIQIERLALPVNSTCQQEAKKDYYNYLFSRFQQIANQHMEYLNQVMHDDYHLQRKALRNIYESLYLIDRSLLVQRPDFAILYLYANWHQQHLYTSKDHGGLCIRIKPEFEFSIHLAGIFNVFSFIELEIIPDFK